MMKAIEFISEDEVKNRLNEMLRKEMADNIKKEIEIKDVRKKTLQECSKKIKEHHKKLQRLVMTSATPGKIVGELNNNPAEKMLKGR